MEINKRTLIEDSIQQEDGHATVSGWVQNVRNHGKIIFVDLRDRSGVLQIVFVKSLDEELFKIANQLRDEFVIMVNGTVKKRSANQVDKSSQVGSYEVLAKNIEILNESATPVFPVVGETSANEDTRMKYRYLDLRTKRMSSNLQKRHDITRFVREYLYKENFMEIETPYLTKGTPEGAREFIVPSRIHEREFYVLPQSPQQFKQLLMTGGVEKYFQIARCFRDEDTRGDRQAEFTQMDMEMSFVSSENIIRLNEKILIELVNKLYPDKHIQETPFPRITYKEAIEKYGTDRPDIRKDKGDPNLLAFLWVVDFPFFEKSDTSDNDDKVGEWTFTHNPFSAPKPECLNNFRKRKNIEDILSSQYDIVLNGSEIGGGSIRANRPDDLRNTFEIMGYSKERIDDNFGHILKALSYGAPPHGGIAWGLDRLVAVLQGETSIRDCIAFPKTGDSRDLLMNAPSDLPQAKIKEANIMVKKG